MIIWCSFCKICHSIDDAFKDSCISSVKQWDCQTVSFSFPVRKGLSGQSSCVWHAADYSLGQYEHSYYSYFFNISLFVLEVQLNFTLFTLEVQLNFTLFTLDRHITFQSWDINWQVLARHRFRTRATGAYVVFSICPSARSLNHSVFFYTLCRYFRPSSVVCSFWSRFGKWFGQSIAGTVSYPKPIIPVSRCRHCDGEVVIQQTYIEPMVI